MLKTCKYCGRVHDDRYDCGKKPKPYDKRHAEDIVHFRGTSVWKHKRIQIKQRDMYLCQACLNNLDGNGVVLNSKDLEVHHIVPIELDETKKLEDTNLITLCRCHHEEAEAGVIPRDALQRIADKNTIKEHCDLNLDLIQH